MGKQQRIRAERRIARAGLTPRQKQLIDVAIVTATDLKVENQRLRSELARLQSKTTTAPA